MPASFHRIGQAGMFFKKVMINPQGLSVKKLAFGGMWWIIFIKCNKTPSIKLGANRTL